MAHTAMKAHGRAVQMLRAYGKQKLMIGCAPTSSVCYPETDHPEDIEAARKAYFSLHEDDICMRMIYERYHKPIYITENGLSCHDVISLDGKVHDPNRIDFLARYLRELRKAAEEADIRGYFQWSLMDNFEWAKGYSDRFGLVYVNYRNQERIMKDSAFWYKHVIETNGAEL